MGDNVRYTEFASANKSIAADDVGGVMFQRIKPAFGSDGVAQDVDDTHPMPVKVSRRYFSVAGATLTRPANTTAYDVNDSISNSATAGSVTALTSNALALANDAPFQLSEILLDSTDTGPGTSSVLLRMHLFNSDPTASSGVGAGDNAAYSNKRAGWIGSFSGVMRAFSDGSKGVLVPDAGGPRIILPVSGAANLYWQLQTLGIFTPSANSTTFTPRFVGLQGTP